MKCIQKYAYSFFLGAAMGAFAKLDPTDWQLYAILIPTVILVEWKARLK